MSSVKRSFGWLLLSTDKKDARIIDAKSELWGSTSHFDKFTKTEGTEVQLLVGNKQVTYVVVQQGMGNFEKNLAELRSKYNMQITSNMGISQTEAPPQSTDTSSTTVKAVSVTFLILSQQFEKFCSNKRQFQFSVVSFSSQTRLNDFFNFTKISYCLVLRCSSCNLRNTSTK